MVFTSLERIVLESLRENKKSVAEIVTDTNLDLRHLAHVLHSLTTRNILKKENAYYEFNPQLRESMVQLLQNKESLRAESIEMIDSLLTNADSNFKAKKIYLTELDKKIFYSHLKSLEDFLKQLERCPKTQPLHKYDYVFWGFQNYGDSIKQTTGQYL
jgi:hypothetical protein